MGVHSVFSVTHEGINVRRILLRVGFFLRGGHRPLERFTANTPYARH